MSYIDKLEKQLTSGLNDTTPNPEPTVQNHSDSHDPLDGLDYEPVEPTEILNYEEQEERPSEKSIQEQGDHVADDLHKFGFYTSTDFYNDLTPVEYLIDNIIQREAYHMVFGPSGSGKSFVVLDMAETIAYSGHNTEFDQWFDKPVEHGDVIYFVGEGHKGMMKRHRLWCQMHKVNPADVRILFRPIPFALDEKEQAENIIKAVNAVKEFSSNPVLIVFDTLNRYMSGDENSNRDAAVFNAACSKLTDQLKAAVLVLHHSGKSEENKKKSRGASAFFGALDIEFRVEDNGNGLITLTQTKNKDNEKEEPLFFNRKQYEILGVDDCGQVVTLTDKHGKPITSCVVWPAKEYMEALAVKTEERKAEAKKPKYSDSQKFALRTFKESAKKYGRIVIDDETTGHETIWLDAEQWHETFYELSSADNDSTKRTQFSRAKKFMAEDETKNGTTILTIHREGGNEYYCLDLSSDNTEPPYRTEIRNVIKAKEKKEQSDTATTEPKSETTDKPIDNTSTNSNTAAAAEQLCFCFIDTNKEIVYS